VHVVRKLCVWIRKETEKRGQTVGKGTIRSAGDRNSAQTIELSAREKDQLEKELSMDERRVFHRRAKTFLATHKPFPDSVQRTLGSMSMREWELRCSRLSLMFAGRGHMSAGAALDFIIGSPGLTVCHLPCNDCGRESYFDHEVNKWHQFNDQRISRHCGIDMVRGGEKREPSAAST
jgi:hypothetical protein